MDKTAIRNTVERSIWTFVQSFLAAFVVTDMTTASVAALAGVAAVLSLLKTVATTRLADLG